MINCCKCHGKIEPGDEYVQDVEGAICEYCIEEYITDRHDFFEIAQELGMSVKIAPEEPKEEPEKPIPGQMDMFGGVYGENA